MTGNRTSLSLITDILDVLDRHGYVRGDDEHTARAILLISDLAHIYEGSQDHPFGPYINEIPPTRTEPAPPEPASQDAVPISPGEVKTLLAALDIAADYQRDRAELCADCTGQTCPTCESRLQDAQAYDRLSAQLIQTAETSAAAAARQPEPSPRQTGRPASDPPARRQPAQPQAPRLRDRRRRQRLAQRAVPSRRGLPDRRPASRHRTATANPEPDLEAEP